MNRVIGVTDLQRRFRTILSEVVGDYVPYVLAHDSRPEAACIPDKEFTQLPAWEAQQVLYKFDRVMGRLAEPNAVCSGDEVAADVEAARAEGRAVSEKRGIGDYDTIS
jgi:PHD/YefM family antitoxin component YafN of YafNO toxin-antitoxin module